MGMASRVAVMDKGRLLQVGGPRDLYDRPGSRAVAGFFGHVNLFEGVGGARRFAFHGDERVEWRPRTCSF